MQGKDFIEVIHFFADWSIEEPNFINCLGSKILLQTFFLGDFALNMV